MPKKYSWSLGQRLFFIIQHIYFKLLLPFECKKGVFSVIISEITWILDGVFKTQRFNISKKFLSREIITKFGRFTIEPTLRDTIIASPAYERLDIELLLSLIKNELRSHRKVLFVDVGACFGTYTIAVGNACKAYTNLEIYAFEPELPLFQSKSFYLLKKNAKNNKLKHYKLFNLGLGAKDIIKLNEYGIMTKRLDSILGTNVINKFDTIVVKIDTERGEKDVLKGAQDLIHSAVNLVLLIEDYDYSLIKYLARDFMFYQKLTPYNSFWIKK